MHYFKNIIRSAVMVLVALMASESSSAQTMIQMPSHSTVYNGNIRGFWFTAPVDFTIVGLRVPSQAGSGLQYIQVFKINDATPVVYATTSTNFTSLGIVYGATNGVIQNVNIPITAGDKIGIVGQAGTSNSYGNGTSVSATIMGQSVTLARIGYQGNMTTSGIPNYWTEPASSNISRVEVYYETCFTAITAHPSPSTVCETQATTFSANAVDVTSYQWQVDEGSGFVNVANGTYYDDVTTGTLKVKNIPYSFDGNEYRCIAIKGTCMDTSKSAKLSVNGLVRLEDLLPKDTTCVHAAKDLIVNGTGSIASYKWQIFVTGIGYIDVPNQFPYVLAGNKLMITNVQDTLDGSRFRCVVNGVCDIATSTELTLTVNSIPTVAVPPADVHAKHGQNVVFSVQASGKGASYQWQVASPDVFVNINNGGIYSGVKTNTLSVRAVSRVQNDFKFRCIIGTTSGCVSKGDTSNFGLLSVDPPLSVASVSGDDVMLLYPNPTGASDLFIKLSGALYGNDMKYKVVDKTGRTILVGNISSREKTSVNVGSLPADIYLVQILDAGNQPVAQSRFTKL